MQNNEKKFQNVFSSSVRKINYEAVRKGHKFKNINYSTLEHIIVQKFKLYSRLDTRVKTIRNFYIAMKLKCNFLYIFNQRSREIERQNDQRIIIINHKPMRIKPSRARNEQ